jgi:hypothetical protein
MRDLLEIKEKLRKEKSVDLELVINTEYQNRLDELRKYAARTNKELKSPVLRYLQIEEHLRKHLARASKR